jgi:hypothetical protein
MFHYLGIDRIRLGYVVRDEIHPIRLRSETAHIRRRGRQRRSASYFFSSDSFPIHCVR